MLFIATLLEIVPQSSKPKTLFLVKNEQIQKFKLRRNKKLKEKNKGKTQIQDNRL